MAKGPKSYLQQPVIATPVIQHKNVEEPQTAACLIRPYWGSSVWPTDGCIIYQYANRTWSLAMVELVDLVSWRKIQ